MTSIWDLGDMVRDALALVGVTEGRVARWLGRPCDCSERRLKLNQLGAWARRTLIGREAAPAAELEDVMGQWEGARRRENPTGQPAAER